MGDSRALVIGTMLACVLTGGLCGASLRSGWWGIVGLAGVGFLVAGPGEPFIHEGPELRIIGFYAGLVVAVAVAGAVAALLVRRAGVSHWAPRGEAESSSQ
jgi:hypothetical protein